MINENVEVCGLVILHLAASAAAVWWGFHVVAADMRRWLGRRRAY